MFPDRVTVQRNVEGGRKQHNLLMRGQERFVLGRKYVTIKIKIPVYVS